MAMAQRHAAQQGMTRGGPSGLADVLEVLLDKGLVIDAFVRVSLVGIELLTIDARIVVASVDTYLRFAEAVNRLDLLAADNSKNLGDLVGGGSRPSEKAGDRTARREISEAAGGSRSGDDESRASAQSNAHEERNDDGGGTEGDDKGFVARIKERGQVF